jgi:hypothetical protein
MRLSSKKWSETEGYGGGESAFKMKARFAMVRSGRGGDKRGGLTPLRLVDAYERGDEWSR